MTAFHGQMGMFTRALAYILSHGADGLKQVAEDAVLNANYILRSMEDLLHAPFAESGQCMHEALFGDKDFGDDLSTLDLAKARGIEIIERVIMPDELANATEVFLTGTAAEVTPVGEIDQHKFSVGEITNWLIDDYDKAVGKAPTADAA